MGETRIGIRLCFQIQGYRSNEWSLYFSSYQQDNSWLKGFVRFRLQITVFLDVGWDGSVCWVVKHSLVFSISVKDGWVSCFA